MLKVQYIPELRGESKYRNAYYWMDTDSVRCGNDGVTYADYYRDSSTNEKFFVGRFPTEYFTTDIDAPNIVEDTDACAGQESFEKQAEPKIEDKIENKPSYPVENPKCKTCKYYRVFTRNVFACNYALDTNELRGCDATNCDKYVAIG